MIYTTPRAENADRMAQLLIDNGIAARVTNDGGWRGRDHRRFSYINTGAQQSRWPQVWVVRPEDKPRARAILREVGIEPAIRHGEARHSQRIGDPGAQLAARRRATVGRVRLILLAVVGALVALTMLEIF